MISDTSPSQADTSHNLAARFLNAVERIGNALPDPATLFVIGAVAVMLLSHLAVSNEWAVTKTITKQETINGMAVTMKQEVTVESFSLLTRDGLYWAINSMVENFKGFAPLGIVLTGMLGIGVADKSGAVGAALKAFMLIMPRSLLTPTMVFIGIMSSMAMDAGYVVLPPVAAALYRSVGRSPLAGLAAVFAGVSAGFGANLFITGLDPLLATFSQEAARLVDADYHVSATSNWYFVIVSTFVLTATGWAVTAWFVEPRYANRAAEDGGPVLDADDDPATQRLTTSQMRGLIMASVTLLAGLGLVLLAVFVPDAPLYGSDGRFARWVNVVVPLIFVLFLLPGLAYGFAAGTIKNDRDIARMMAQTMADMGPYIVLAFFAAQFVAYFNKTNLGEMLAITGGHAIASANMPLWLLMVMFILLVMCANLFLGSMSAKYAIIAPVFIPMFMTGAQASPELTQAAYRIGDSCSNIITPLNSYLIIILVFMQKFIPKAGMGTLVSLMLPYTIVFGIVWTVMLVVWILLGIPLGPDGTGPLYYLSAQ